MGDLVLWAAFLTLAMTVGLTIYAAVTKSDFTTMGPALFVWALALFFFAILLLFTNNKVLHIIFCVLAIGVYGTYLVFDTQLIMGGKRFKLSIDDYIIAAV
mmetsp:Transcript_22957/g.19920  ORF Transcript_22957/g.19920 Transcript_22957/m.19920 type:complete len:101 (-) Transcript_22957:123-425(-)